MLKNTKKNLYKAFLGLAIFIIFAVLYIFMFLNNNISVNNSFNDSNTQENKNNDLNTEEKTSLVENNIVEESKDQEKENIANWPIELSKDNAESLTVVVNKKHRLPSDYVPDLKSVAGGQMRPEAAESLHVLLDDASANGAPMVILSSYRSYQTQVSTYQYWVDTQGQKEADRGSARPGHSEHQTGLAVDLGNPDGSCRLQECFGEGNAGKWLASHAHEYGFIIRYPSGKENITGYQYEPWHIRYLGVDVASKVMDSGKTLDEYFNVEAGDY